jgi:hypothetical protein
MSKFIIHQNQMAKTEDIRKKLPNKRIKRIFYEYNHKSVANKGTPD